MHFVSNNSYFQEWRKLVCNHLETTVVKKAETARKDYFVQLCDALDKLMEDKLYTQMDQFGGIAAATIGVTLDFKEYTYIQNNIGPVNETNFGYYVLYSIAEEAAQALAFGVFFPEEEKIG